MVSNSILKAYEFETIEDYFDYILTSKINGQHGQVVSLIKAMSKKQKIECLDWIDRQDEIQMYKPEDWKYCKKILLENI